MDIFDDEIIRFWVAIRKYIVKYIMVGGYATNIHGYQRYTGDLDIWIQDTSLKRANLRKAFETAGM